MYLEPSSEIPPSLFKFIVESRAISPLIFLLLLFYNGYRNRGHIICIYKSPTYPTKTLVDIATSSSGIFILIIYEGFIYVVFNLELSLIFIPYKNIIIMIKAK